MAELANELGTFESFFKTFGFKRVHGRVWGLLLELRLPLEGREALRGLSEQSRLKAGSKSRGKKSRERHPL